jgi:hypothetical protein
LLQILQSPLHAKPQQRGSTSEHQTLTVKTKLGIYNRNNNNNNNTKTNINFVDFSPHANYTDCATATGRRILMPTFADKRVSLGRRGGSARPLITVPRPESLLLLSSNSSFILTRLSGPRSRPTTTQKIW